MEMTRFGRTGLTVSVVGLGCGGHSRLGQLTGATRSESERVVQRAIDLGITFIDTAVSYGNEDIVGAAIIGARDDLVLSTKALVSGPDGRPVTGSDLRRSLDGSLQRLRTDRVDVFHLHGVHAHEYRHCVEELRPVMSDLHDEGKIRSVAISEAFNVDSSHEMLRLALTDDCWDTMMVGFNIVNQSARRHILPRAIAQGVGVSAMYAVRRALASPAELRQIVQDLISEGYIDAGGIDPADPLGFLVREGEVESVTEAAYRYARHEPGIDVVLTGTGNVSHLEANAESITAAPLDPEHVERLAEMFGTVEHLSISAT